MTMLGIAGNVSCTAHIAGDWNISKKQPKFELCSESVYNSSDCGSPVLLLAGSRKRSKGILEVQSLGRM